MYSTYVGVVFSVSSRHENKFYVDIIDETVNPLGF